MCVGAGVPSYAQQLTSAEKELIELDFFYNGQGMHLSPGILSKFEAIRAVIGGSRLDNSLLKTLMKRWGIQERPGQNFSELVGIKNVTYKNYKVGVLGCVACHSGKAAGQYIVGIGNKNIDPAQIGTDGVRIEEVLKKLSGLRKKDPVEKELTESSLKLMRKLTDPRMRAETQGLVPVSLVGSWFYEMAGAPIPSNGYKGSVKVPSWFGFEKKLEVGQFADAIGKGHPPGWIIGVEITSGTSPRNVREYFSRVEHASSLISRLNPPSYPFFIRSDRAELGKKTFEQTCAKCHGTYEYNADGSPIYKTPKMVPIESIGTDTDRLDYVTSDFLEKVRSNPLSDLIQLSDYAGKRMMVAPRLHAIWARFPYLHNASVPTLRDLLEPASKRPKLFSIRDAGELERFDQTRMGLTGPKTDQELRDLARDLRRKKRWIYDVSKHGQSNQGHEKFVDLPDSDKDNLVEYLKTL
ncbi:MAG: hypothetical protein JST80_13840 [Bdellovibrionales bacterium]|nr:hypothetical protein [Bdellovibrionales bacterium]